MVIKTLQSLIKSRYFNIFIMCSIIANTLVLAMDSYPNSLVKDHLPFINYIFAAIFIIEMCLKIIGLGFKHYFLDPFNILDCTTVLATVIEIITNFVLKAE